MDPYCAVFGGPPGSPLDTKICPLAAASLALMRARRASKRVASLEGGPVMPVGLGTGPAGTEFFFSPHGRPVGGHARVMPQGIRTPHFTRVRPCSEQVEVDDAPVEADLLLTRSRPRHQCLRRSRRHLARHLATHNGLHRPMHRQTREVALQVAVRKRPPQHTHHNHHVEE